MAAKLNDIMRGDRRRLWLWLAGVAVVHVLLLPWVWDEFVGNASTKPHKKRVDMISLNATHGGDYRLPPGYKRPPVPAKPAQPKPQVAKKDEKKQEPLPKGQVVDIPPSPDGRAPDKAAYLAEHNSHTERETRSRHQSRDYANVQHEPSTDRAPQKGPQGQAKAPKAVQVGPSRPGEAAPSAAKRAVLEIPKVSQRDRLALRLDPDLGQYHNQPKAAAQMGNSDRLKVVPGEQETAETEAPSAAAPALSMDDLVPSLGTLTRLSGGPSNDALENVEEGEGTFLNAREFKYASFFNRLKHGVSQHWNAQTEFQRRDPTGNIYGLRARLTVVNVTLNGDGSLQNVAVKQSCGVDFLDDEAMAAFQRAQPFPNPPHGLLDPNGQVTFAFGFQIMIVPH